MVCHFPKQLLRVEVVRLYIKTDRCTGQVNDKDEELKRRLPTMVPTSAIYTATDRVLHLIKNDKLGCAISESQSLPPRIVGLLRYLVTEARNIIEKVILICGAESNRLQWSETASDQGDIGIACTKLYTKRPIIDGSFLYGPVHLPSRLTILISERAPAFPRTTL